MCQDTYQIVELEFNDCTADILIVNSDMVEYHIMETWHIPGHVVLIIPAL